MRPLPVLIAAPLLLLAACSAAGTSRPPAPTPTIQPAAQASPVTPSPPPSPVYDNSQACTAFGEATTTGIPASANAPAGMSTTDWLAAQVGDAAPRLAGLIESFVNAWGAVPPDTGEIDSAQAAITRYCKHHA